MTNCYNQTFNVQFFLNEQCKDAINMSEFIENMELDLTDLTETSLRFEHKLFKYFVTEQLPMVKREHMWIGFLPHH